MLVAFNACTPLPWGNMSYMVSEANCSRCQAGKYSISYGANSPSVCQNCSSGTYGSGTGLNSSAECITCTAGYFATGQALTSPTNCSQCLNGSYCIGGSSYGCPGGTTSTPGTGSQLGCTCNAGYVCQAAQTVNVEVYSPLSVGQLNSELGVIQAELAAMVGVGVGGVFMYGVNASGV